MYIKHNCIEYSLIAVFLQYQSNKSYDVTDVNSVTICEKV